MTEDAHELCCSRCGGPRDRPRQRYCRQCFNAYRRRREACRTQAAQIVRRSGLAIAAAAGGQEIGHSVNAVQNVYRNRMDEKPK